MWSVEAYVHEGSKLLEEGMQLNTNYMDHESLKIARSFEREWAWPPLVVFEMIGSVLLCP